MLEYGSIFIHSICQKEKLLLCEKNKTTGSNYDRKWRFFYINRFFHCYFLPLTSFIMIVNIYKKWSIH